MAKVKPLKNDISTEEKIKQAARSIFIQKGYAATRTRDIAAASGINLALLNYYFRSKEKLFRLVMMETVQQFVEKMKITVNEKSSTLEQKLENIVSNYIDLLIAEPNFPIFILNEVQSNPDMLMKETGIKDYIVNSVFTKQLDAHFKKKKTVVNPVHFLMNFAGLTVFPFVAKPMIKAIATINDSSFNALMLERKKLIPLWVNTMLN